MAVVSRGRPALTHYRTVAAAAGISLLEMDLATGRTHQIRVHLKHIGHPLVGDPVYGEARWKGLPRPVQAPLRDFPRPALHAWRIAFRHPATDELLRFEAPVPEDLRELWERVTGRSW
jgi:23S rRNA pseudouridine1911/1915/1917 synthase